MADKITFDNKVSTIISSLPEINRITGSNVNEIKSVVNEHADELTVEDFASQITFSESPLNYHMKKQGNIVCMDYNGQSKAHSSGALLFTIPEGYRPTGSLYTPFIQNGVYGRVEVNGGNGQVKVSEISNTSLSARVSFAISYIVS